MPSQLGKPLCDTSDNFFTIIAAETPTQPSITVVSPNGGETLIAGSTFEIKWKYSSNIMENLTKFSVHLIDSNGKIVTGGIGDNLGTPVIVIGDYYMWQVSPNLPVGKYKVVVSLCPTGGAAQCQSSVTTNPNGLLNDSSDNYFTLTGTSTGSPVLNVLSPNGGEEFIIGKTYAVKWNSINLPPSASVKLYVVSSDGTVQNTLVDNFPNSGIYYWTVPSNQLEGANRFYVSYGQYSDHSDNIFEVWATSRR